MINDFRDCMIDGSYADTFFSGKYERYVNARVWDVRRFHTKGSIVSIGCGTGDIEARLPYRVVCHDIHDAAKILHPDLDFRYEWPSERFETVICFAVLPYVPTGDQSSFVDRLVNLTTDDGTVLLHNLDYRGTEQDVVQEKIYPVTYPSHPKIKLLVA